MSLNKKIKLAFAGGGSGGHVMPISSLIKYINKNNEYSDKIDEIFWFGQKWQMEEKEFDKISKSVDVITNCHQSNDDIYIKKKNILTSVLIIDNNTDADNIINLKLILEKKWFTNIQIVKRQDFDFDEMSDYDLYILSGWHDTKTANHIEYYKNETKLLSLDKNIIWICLWMQIIAKYFDSNISKNETKISWNIYINYQNHKYQVQECHNYRVDKLWNELEWLAKSDYWYEIIKHKTKNIYWLQFHPEKYISLQNWDEIFEDILSKMFWKDYIYISEANLKDLEEIKNINIEWWENNVNIDIWMTKDAIDKFQEDLRRLRFAQKESFFPKNWNLLVARKNNEIAWYAKFFVTKQNINLMHSLYIKRKYQWMWIWSLLLEKTINYFDNQDIYLEVVEYNDQAIDFYKKHWFEIVDWSKESYDIWNDVKYPYVTMLRKWESLDEVQEESEYISDIYIPKLSFVSILSGKLRRQPNFKEILLNVADIFKFTIWIFQSLRYIYSKKIDVVFCKWWYVALPVVIAAKILRRKIIVHESDTKSWLVNRVAAKFANTIYTWFDNVLPKWQTIGQIISDEIVTEDILKSSDQNLLKSKSIILVNLWSLGSASVHDALLYIFVKYPDLLINYEWHIILWSLNANYEEKYQEIIKKVVMNRASSSSSEKSSNLTTYTFVDQKTMWKLLYISDISICRWGTTGLAEQKLFGLKQIIIPIPRTHDQAKNAEFYKSEYQDIYIAQNKDLAENIYKEIIWLQNFHKDLPNLQTIKNQIKTAKKIICDEIVGK